MVNHCANPKCSKPLHYLREGRIFVFDVPDTRPNQTSGSARGRRMEHYWLCGDCSQTLLLERTSERDIRLIPKQTLRQPRLPVAIINNALAS